MSSGDDPEARRQAVRERLHMIRGGPEEGIGNRVVHEGLRQLSLPGQYARGLLAGRPGEKVTSEEMLKGWGVKNPHPVGQFAWDVATDPLTYAGPGLMKAGGAASDLLRAGGAALGEGPAANPLVNAMGKFGRGESGALGLKFDPYRHAKEVGLKPSDPEWVNNRTFYHGSANPAIAGSQLDPMVTLPNNLFGRGIYTTEDLKLARDYAREAGGRAAGGETIGGSLPGRPTVYEAQSDFRRVLDLDRALKDKKVIEAFRDVAAQIPAARIPASRLTRSPLQEFEETLRYSKKPRDWFSGIFVKPGLARWRPLAEGEYDAPAALLRRLKEEGIDAMVHKGDIGPNLESSGHVVIGLDPNDVLGMGRVTPYKQWQPDATIR